MTLHLIKLGGMSAAFAGLLMQTPLALASTTIISYDGKGFSYDGSVYNLNDQRCGAAGQGIANDGGTGQFGPNGELHQAGDPYLVWVLTANGASKATLTLPDKSEVPMIKVGGTFKYASKYFPYTATSGAQAEYVGGKSKATLTVSHGCPVFQNIGAWCSPGFWRNAEVGAWILTNQAKTNKFNNNVHPSFYGAEFSSDPNLSTVLTTFGNTYKGAGVPGSDLRVNTDATKLNAFNATGAFLTDQIPGYTFDRSLVDIPEADGEHCPIDNHGNLKTPQQ